jgi:hypothetical protein
MNAPFKQKGWNPFSKKKKTYKEIEKQYNKDFYNFVHTGGGFDVGGSHLNPENWVFRGDLVPETHMNAIKDIQGRYNTSGQTHRGKKWWKTQNPENPSSPLNQMSLRGSGVGVSFDEDKNIKTDFTVQPTLSTGNLNIGGKLTYTPPKLTSEGGRSGKGNVFVGGTTDINIGSRRNKRDYDMSSFGRLSLTGGLNIGSGEHGDLFREPTGSARLTIGAGRPGDPGCYRGMCYAPAVSGYNIGGFGEVSSDSPKGKFGLSGRYGIFTGEASYDLATKQKQYKLGLSFSPNWKSKKR